MEPHLIGTLRIRRAPVRGRKDPPRPAGSCNQGRGRGRVDAVRSQEGSTLCSRSSLRGLCRVALGPGCSRGFSVVLRVFRVHCVQELGAFEVLSCIQGVRMDRVPPSSSPPSSSSTPDGRCLRGDASATLSSAPRARRRPPPRGPPRAPPGRRPPPPAPEAAPRPPGARTREKPA